MRQVFLPFSKPTTNNRDIEAVNDVLRSGWITTGQRTTAFEQAFSKTIGCNSAVALTSATTGTVK